MKPGRGALDPYSSSATFDGWKDAPRPAEPPRVTSPPRTWLLATGWRKRGLLSLDEVPARPGEGVTGTREGHRDGNGGT